jgi:hypothetical protein
MEIHYNLHYINIDEIPKKKEAYASFQNTYDLKVSVSVVNTLAPL